LAREQSDSSILVREGLVRFARKYHARLQGDAWYLQFKAKLKQLQQAGIIPQEIVDYCLKAVHNGREGSVEARAGAQKTGDATETTIDPSKHENGPEPVRERK